MRPPVRCPRSWAGGLLLDPYHTGAIADAIRAIDADDALVARLSAAGLAQAARFSDQAFVARLPGLYAKLDPDAAR